MNEQLSSNDDGSLRLGKGEATRAAILLAAAQLATTRGLQGLSIGDLASHLGMSKSGLYAHFKSKEELELATIETAAQIFDREVLQLVRDSLPGSRRLMTLVDAFLSHLERRVFPGGCFFAGVAAELDTRPGRARDRVLEVLVQWRSLIRQCLDEARTQKEIRDVDLDQAVFEIQAMLTAANFLFVMTDDSTLLQQARKGIEHILDRLQVRPTIRKKPGTRREA